MKIKAWLETKIPPPVYGLFTALIIWWIAQTFPVPGSVPLAFKKLGLVLMVFGLLIDMTALGQFLIKKTTPNPLSPEKANIFVASGLYRFSRNPMYLGLLILLTGWTLRQGSLTGLICLPLFVLLMNHLQIIPEERALKKKFGKPYTSYLKKVRRWL